MLISPLCPLQGNDNFNASNRKQLQLLLGPVLQLSCVAGKKILISQPMCYYPLHSAAVAAACLDLLFWL